MLQLLISTHILAGLTAVIAGATAMLAPKRPGRHPNAGRVYLGAIGLLYLTAVGIVLARPHTAYLLAPGTLALATAALGFIAKRLRGRLRHHLTCMGTSYIALLTTFYVDNGPRLPYGSCSLRSPSGSCPPRSACR